MGTVWLAQDLLLDSSCALKLIDDDKAESEEVRIRFAREAKVAAQLRGPHVVDVFDHGEWSGIPYIAMEFLDGEDLGTRLDRVKKLDPEATYRIVAHVARALVKAHAYGIVHRDLKPENVFLVEGDEGEIAKVVDFGIAKHDAYSLRDKTTKTGSFLGTPFYVSPEQARGKPTDHRSDLWSLGVIAFQCLTGRPPFESEALGELMGMILYDDIPIPSQRNPELSSEIDDWWKRAAARDREQRFESAKDQQPIAQP
jgi:serine/threonine-protein kinase